MTIYNIKGEHLLLDLYGVDDQLLLDRSTALKCLHLIYTTCKLTPVCNPLIHRFDNSGITGIVMLCESHASIHTYPERQYAGIDVYSCNGCDLNEAADQVIGLFKPVDRTIKIIPRGV